MREGLAEAAALIDDWVARSVRGVRLSAGDAAAFLLVVDHVRRNPAPPVPVGSPGKEGK